MVRGTGQDSDGGDVLVFGTSIDDGRSGSVPKKDDVGGGSLAARASSSVGRRPMDSTSGDNNDVESLR